MKEQQFAQLYTPEGELVGDIPWSAHPRPQFQRGRWVNLNGWWDFACSERGEAPAVFNRRIRVPFPPQSLLSGIHERITDGTVLFYRRSFPRPEGAERVLLHIGAADQQAEVWLNGICLGSHAGGYEPFTFDITHVLQGENILLIRVTDHLNDHILPYGKQCSRRGGMWYTPVSGLWQTVWLECVPQRYIRNLRIQTGAGFVEFHTEGEAQDGTITIQTPQGELEVPLQSGTARVLIPQPRLWSPEDPYLYRCILRAGSDMVESYFALRTLEIKELNGIQRLCLNGRPYFFHGLLDQGYWSDGLFTPADSICYEKDILTMKSLGFNTLRKHIKVEAERFYYDCDRLGMIVFQDFVNNGGYSFLRDTALPTVGLKRRDDRKLHRDKAAREAFLAHMEATVRRLDHHPCICCWTIFNEGWGQFDSTACYRRLKTLDPTRFIDTASGWFRGGESDVVSEHVYFKPFKVKKTDQPLILSEFGGYACKVDGHVFNLTKEYGYRHFKEQEAYGQAVAALYEQQIIPAIPQGLCGAIYTQVSDVEDETNGLVTYDRRVTKLSPEVMLPLAEKLKL